MDWFHDSKKFSFHLLGFYFLSHGHKNCQILLNIQHKLNKKNFSKNAISLHAHKTRDNLVKLKEQEKGGRFKRLCWSPSEKHVLIIQTEYCHSFTIITVLVIIIDIYYFNSNLYLSAVFQSVVLVSRLPYVNLFSEVVSYKSVNI